MAGCFKTYDIRGRIDSELTEQVAFRVGVAYSRLFRPGKVVVGRDMRLSSPALTKAVTAGLKHGGTEVLDLGLCGTEMVYFATFHGGHDGGIMVTASHNPADYNGMKLVGEKGVPLIPEDLRRLEKTVLGDLQELTYDPRSASHAEGWDPAEDYLDNLCRLVPPDEVGRWKVLCDGGHGAAGPLLKRIQERYPSLELILRREEPDGTFPDGVPNPLLPENRRFTSAEVKASGADIGVAWDGDFDRCFLFDNEGEFVDSYYLIGPLAEFFLKRSPGKPILYDPRLTWCTIDRVQELGGVPTLCQTGHVFFKQAMKATGALYGGEMSGHHYFRDFGNCDSGMLPWLVMLRLLKAKGSDLHSLVARSREKFPISGEINRSVDDADRVLELIRERYRDRALTHDDIDGVSYEFSEWRFNLRKSNTEPLIRLNVESRGSVPLMREKTAEILEFVEQVSSSPV